MAKPRQRIHSQRDDINRQARAKTRVKADHFGPVVVVMHQQARRDAACLAIGRCQRRQPAEQGIYGRRVIGDRPRGANRRTATATRADHRVNRHMFPGRGDRPRRAEVQTVGTGGLPGPRMGAKTFSQPHVKRLFKGADHLHGLAHGLCYGGLAARIGPQIAVTFVRRGKQRCIPRQIQNDIALRLGPVPRRGERRHAAPTGDQHLQLVKGQAEIAQCARRLAQVAFDHVKTRINRPVIIALPQHRRRQRIGHRLCHLKRERGRGHDQTRALRHDIHHPWCRCGKLLLRHQGGHLGRRVALIVVPAGAVANIDELGNLCVDLGGQLLETGTFLLARDHGVARGHRLCRGADLVGAQTAIDLGARQTRRP